MNTTTEIKPDIRVVKLDETHFWTDKELVEQCGGQIFGVYVYDANRHVHCCSITPSYELHFVESQAVGVIEDDVQEKLMEADADTEPVSYYNVRTIDVIEEVDSGLFPHHSHRFKLDSTEPWGETSDEAVEEALDWVRSNSV